MLIFEGDRVGNLVVGGCIRFRRLDSCLRADSIKIQDRARTLQSSREGCSSLRDRWSLRARLSTVPAASISRIEFLAKFLNSDASDRVGTIRRRS